MRIVDTLIVFRILKLLTTPFEKQKAYHFGYIDKNGKRITHVMKNGVKVRNVPFTKMEKSSLTLLHRLVFNLKRLIEKVPLGKTQFASYAVALALLKEHCELSDEQGEELYEKFYRWLKENDNFNPEHITETIGFQNDLSTGTYHLRHRLDGVAPRTEIRVDGVVDKIYGINVYEGYVGDRRILLSAEDVY